MKQSIASCFLHKKVAKASFHPRLVYDGFKTGCSRMRGSGELIQVYNLTARSTCSPETPVMRTK